jgi:hypothetical protein
MSDQPDAGNQRSSARGDAAWKEETERIAARNQAARKAGKERRAAYEQGRDAARNQAERQRHIDLLAKGRPR